LLLVVVVYVDDLLIAGANMAEIDQLKEALKQSFDMSDLGQVKNLLGMQIEHLEDRSLFLHQSRYIEDILKKFGMHKSKAVDTPMAARIVPSDSAFDQKEYQRITGSEMWPSLGCRFDIAYATGFLARFNSAPTTAHHSAQMRLLRYLHRTVGFRILYSASCSEDLVAFVDTD
jgi:Reverse transcriptase (RNA-dependent DNA polymerase)